MNSIKCPTTKLQKALYEVFERNPYGNIILKYAEVFLIVYIGKMLAIFLPHSGFKEMLLTKTTAIAYVFYVFGVLLCYSKNSMSLICIIFSMKALKYLYIFFKFGFDPNNTVYAIVYVAITCMVIRKISEKRIRSASNTESKTNTFFCNKCGEPMNENDTFCGKCGQQQKSE